MRKTVIGIGLAIFLEIMRIAKDCYSTQISDSIARPMIAIDNVCNVCYDVIIIIIREGAE